MVQEAPRCKDTEHARSLWILRRGLVRRLARLAVLQWSWCMLVVLCLFPACLHQLQKNCFTDVTSVLVEWTATSNVSKVLEFTRRISQHSNIKPHIPDFHTIHEYFLNKPHPQKSTSSLDTSWTSTHLRIPHHHWKRHISQNSTPSLTTFSDQTPPPEFHTI